MNVAVFATVWRVNNTPGAEADFTTLQAAHDGASAGDTIYLEASHVSYGNLTATKQLVIIGTGYFLAENPTTQANLNSSKTGSITFNNGSQGSVITGCDITNVITINTSDLVIERNAMVFSVTGNGMIRLGTNDVTDIMIISNYLYNTNSSTSRYVIRSWGSGIGNVTITNNFIRTHHGQSYPLHLSDGFTGLIENNVISGRVLINNAEFNNNIIRGGDMFSATNSTWFNNLSHSTQVGTDNGNQINIDMNTVFEKAGSTDGWWQLKDASPALGAGLGGIDCGMFDGLYPYKLSGIPAIPAVYFHGQSIDNVNHELNVSVKVKSHN